MKLYGSRIILVLLWAVGRTHEASECPDAAGGMPEGARCEFFQLQPETSRQVCLSHLKCEHKPDTQIYCECPSRIKFTRQELAFNL